MKISSFALILALSISLRASELRLTDGQTFQNWSVIGQTDDSITIKHSKGGVKISKYLLPPEVLKDYPIVATRADIRRAMVEEKIDLELAPEPKSDIDRSVPGERSLRGKLDNGLNIQWICRADVDNGQFDLIRYSHGADLKNFKSDFFLRVDVASPEVFLESLLHAMRWLVQVHKDKAPAFEKSAGVLLGEEWLFKWDRKKGVITNGSNTISEDDLDKIGNLLKVRQYAWQEIARKVKATEDYAATLK